MKVWNCLLFGGFFPVSAPHNLLKFFWRLSQRKIIGTAKILELLNMPTNSFLERLEMLWQLWICLSQPLVNTYYTAICCNLQNHILKPCITPHLILYSIPALTVFKYFYCKILGWIIATLKLQVAPWKEATLNRPE